jgi:hypothetical protein
MKKISQEEMDKLIAEDKVTFLDQSQIPYFSKEEFEKLVKKGRAEKNDL